MFELAGYLLFGYCLIWFSFVCGCSGCVGVNYGSLSFCWFGVILVYVCWLLGVICLLGCASVVCFFYILVGYFGLGYTFCFE